MTPWEAILLGIVQGLTEFLPVSSSGHLVLAQAALGVRLPGVVFEVVVHLATLCAVLWVYRERVLALARGVVAGDRESWTYVLLLAVATVPIALVGFFGRSFLRRTFEEPMLAAALLLVTGGLDWSISKTASREGDERPDLRQSLGVGLSQAVAILPGISRSGITVATGTWLGVDPIRIAEFSFLMSVPAIAGAGVLELRNLEAATHQGGAGILALGFAAALICGILAIHLFLRMLERRTFHRFAYYCWTVGLLYLGAALLVPALRG